MKLLVTMLAALCCFTINADQQKLTVGTNTDFAPFSFIQNGEITGFDIDVAKEAGRRMGCELQFKDMPFDALIPDIVMGNVDFAAAGFSYTDERAKRVDFTNNYLDEDPLVIISLKEPVAFDDLKGKSVVVVEGFTADILMSSVQGIELTRLPTQADAFMALLSKRADVFVNAKSTVDNFIASHPNIAVFQQPIEGSGETCALVVPKGKKELRDRLQKALNEMEADGTMQTLKIKWKLAAP